MIKTIIFDLGNVLVPFDIRLGYQRLQEHTGLSPDEIPARVRSSGLVPRYEMGEMSSENFVAELSQVLDLKIGYDEFRELWSAIFLHHELVPERLVEALSKRYRMLVLSNTNDLHFSMLENQYPILRHFNDFVLSHKVGAAKPSARIYESAIKLAQCRAEECFFTDDVPAFVDGAQKAGIDAVLFESAQQLEADLRKRGVEW